MTFQTGLSLCRTHGGEFATNILKFIFK